MEIDYEVLSSSEQKEIADKIHIALTYWCKGQNAPFDPGSIQEEIYWKENITDRFLATENELRVVKTEAFLKSYLSSKMTLKVFYIDKHRELVKKFNSQL